MGSPCRASPGQCPSGDGTLHPGRAILTVVENIVDGEAKHRERRHAETRGHTAECQPSLSRDSRRRGECPGHDG
jgi:hypothetical protein